MAGRRELEPRCAHARRLARAAADACIRTRSTSGSTACATCARRLELAAPALPGDHRRRHERQRLDASRSRRASCARPGYRVGAFTSPHLLRYNERICVDGVEVTDAELIEAFERIDAARGDITLTFFEYNALAALAHVRRRRSSTRSVLEVGLGGRLDAINIVDADVARRHVRSASITATGWATRSRRSAARRPGIFRAGRPAVLGSPDMPASIRESAQHVGARPAAARPRLRLDARPGERWNWRGAERRARAICRRRHCTARSSTQRRRRARGARGARIALERARAAIERGLQTCACRGGSRSCTDAPRPSSGSSTSRTTRRRRARSRRSCRARRDGARSRCAESSATRTSRASSASCAARFDIWIVVGSARRRARCAPDDLHARLRRRRRERRGGCGGRRRRLPGGARRWRSRATASWCSARS